MQRFVTKVNNYDFIFPFKITIHEDKYYKKLNLMSNKNVHYYLVFYK